MQYDSCLTAIKHECIQEYEDFIDKPNKHGAEKVIDALWNASQYTMFKDYKDKIYSEKEMKNLKKGILIYY